MLTFFSLQCVAPPHDAEIHKGQDPDFPESVFYQLIADSGSRNELVLFDSREHDFATEAGR